MNFAIVDLLGNICQRDERREAESTPSARAGRVAELPVATQALAVPPSRISVTASARRRDQHPVAAPEDVLLPVVHAAAGDPHDAESARPAARESRRRIRRALGHEGHDDRPLGLGLEQDVLTEAPAEASATARSGAEAFVMEEERA